MLRIVWILQYTQTGMMFEGEATSLAEAKAQQLVGIPDLGTGSTPKNPKLI